MIRLDVLKDYNRAAEYAAVCWYAMGENPGAITPEFMDEINGYIANANSDRPVIDHDHGLAFALYEDDGTIVGTLCVNQERHFTGCAQFNHFALIPAARGQMYGRYILNKVRDQIKQYGDFHYVIGSTVTAGPFYEALKIQKIGEITADGYTRYYYGAEI